MIRQSALGSLFGRLGFRLMAAIGLALLPLAILAYVQAGQFQAEATARVKAALFGETLQAAAPQIEAIENARGAAAALSVSIRPTTGDSAACTEVMRSFVQTEPNIVFAGFIPVDGLMTCASTGESHQFADTPQRRALYEDPKPVMSVNPKGPISGEAVLIFSHPVTEANGRLLGFVSLSMPHRALQAIQDRRGDFPLTREPLSLVTFDAKGTLLTALNGVETAFELLPAGRDLQDFVDLGAITFTGVSVGGDARTFSVLPIVEGSLYILASWPPPERVTGAFGEGIPLWAFPTAMWLASLVVAWMAAEHQVLRHIRSLRASITAFAGGSRTVEPPALASAPNELRDVGDAYESLVDSVLHDEAALEDSIHQKEVLLREVHHRVKNNLQLIASIMNIQMRKAVSPEARALVKGLHDRVMSLATVHRELYQTTGLTDVKADELLSTIVAQVLRMGASPSRVVDLTTEFDPIRLTPDQSVPLSLLMTEALTNVLKHAGAGTGQRIALSVSLTRQPEGRALMRVANSLPDPQQDRGASPVVDSTGMGEQLLAAFAMQLSGALSVKEDSTSYVVAVEFPVRALSEAEHRFAAD
jgi:two-component sensor histidine kinase